MVPLCAGYDRLIRYGHTAKRLIQFQSPYNDLPYTEWLQGPSVVEYRRSVYNSIRALKLNGCHMLIDVTYSSGPREHINILYARTARLQFLVLCLFSR